MLRGVAQQCCRHGACKEYWQQLAAEASRAAFNATTTSELCKSLTTFCTRAGNVVELLLDVSGFECDVRALAPLAQLHHLEVLQVGGTNITGARAHLLHLL